METFKINLISGRDFYDTDKLTEDEIILNELAAKKLNFDPEKDRFIEFNGHKMEVIGITEDFLKTFDPNLIPEEVERKTSDDRGRWPLQVLWSVCRRQGCIVRGV